MKSPKLALLLGFLVWCIPFVASFIIFPLKQSSPSLFESIMPVVISISAVVAFIRYSNKVPAVALQESVEIGFLWLFISVLIDAPLFLIGGPMKMSVSNYVMDIGLTYLMIPIITIGFGYILEKSWKRGRA